MIHVPNVRYPYFNQRPEEEGIKTLLNDTFFALLSHFNQRPEEAGIKTYVARIFDLLKNSISINAPRKRGLKHNLPTSVTTQ